MLLMRVSDVVDEVSDAVDEGVWLPLLPDTC